MKGGSARPELVEMPRHSAREPIETSTRPYNPVQGRLQLFFARLPSAFTSTMASSAVAGSGTAAVP